MRSRALAQRVLFSVLIAFAAGCIGTEYVEDPVSPPSMRLLISPSNASLRVGDMLQLQAVHENGTPAAGQLLWVSSDTTVVGVGADGVATGRSVGQARITVRLDEVIGEIALLTVVADQNHVARVVVGPPVVQLAAGNTHQFTATAYALNGNIVTGVSPVWRSTNSRVVSINPSGLATAGETGSAEITAAVDGIESNPARVTVSGSSRSGLFVMRPGSGHDVRGTATLLQQANGSLTLTFGSDFASAGGPDVRVYLSTSNSINSTSLSLGQLQRFTGFQTYTVPAGVQLNTFDWVIVHCVPFNITFGYARLQ